MLITQSKSSSISLSKPKQLSTTWFLYPVRPLPPQGRRKLTRVSQAKVSANLSLCSRAPRTHQHSDSRGIWLHRSSTRTVSGRLRYQLDVRCCTPVKNHSEKRNISATPAVASCRDAYGQLLRRFWKKWAKFPRLISNWPWIQFPIESTQETSLWPRARANPLPNTTSSLMLALLASRNSMLIVRLK